MEGSKKSYDEYWEGLRFAYHQAARKCVTEREFVDAMYLLNILPGTVEFAEAKRAWERFRRARKDTP
jgi:hypothetical protein